MQDQHPSQPQFSHPRNGNDPIVFGAGPRERRDVKFPKAAPVFCGVLKGGCLWGVDGSGWDSDGRGEGSAAGRGSPLVCTLTSSREHTQQEILRLEELG